MSLAASTFPYWHDGFNLKWVRDPGDGDTNWIIIISAAAAIVLDFFLSAFDFWRMTTELKAGWAELRTAMLLSSSPVLAAGASASALAVAAKFST